MPSKTKETSKRKKNDENKIEQLKRAVEKATKKLAVKAKSDVSKVSSKEEDTKKEKNEKKAKKATTKSTKTTKKVASSKSKKTSTPKVKKSSTSSVKKAEEENKFVDIVEYYDLPYRYNETIVKILYQTPDTLFVYWDISDKDREEYINKYGENFFNITRPVLIVHNDTMNYSFEIPINDFANSWYLHINDSKCDYRVELGRRPNHYSEEATKEIQETIHTDYIYVSSSNEIESPNDHVLFNTNANNTINFRNVKTNVEKSVSLFDIIKNLPTTKKYMNVPYISEELLKALYSGIYENEDISLFEKISNPSSGGNPSSGNMSSSRFM